MTLTVFRLGKHALREQLFSGAGGLYASGRWTPRGLPVVYASASISLAVLEYTVNYRRRGWVPKSVLGRAGIPAEASIRTLEPEELPADWFAATPPPELRRIGGEWLESRRVAILKVPSAIVTEEWNYLLNPQHADFGRFTFGRPELFRFDRRIARGRA